jgi:hypothetical protein
MSDDAYPTGPQPMPGPVETKTKAGALGAYAGAFVLLAVLTNTTTDLSFLPDWLETLVYPLLPTVVAFLAAYVKKHKPGQLSLSARRAAGRHEA